MGQTNSCVAKGENKYEGSNLWADVFDPFSPSGLKKKLKDYGYKSRLDRLYYAEKNMINIILDNKDLYNYFTNKYLPDIGEYIKDTEDIEYKTNIQKLAKLTLTDKHSDNSFMWCLSRSIYKINHPGTRYDTPAYGEVGLGPFASYNYSRPGCENIKYRKDSKIARNYVFVSY